MRFPDLLNQVNAIEEQVRAHDELLAALLRGRSIVELREEYLDGVGQAPGEQIRNRLEDETA